MKTIIISLPSSTARRKRVLRELEETGLEYEFLEATNGEQTNFQYAERTCPRKSRKQKGYSLIVGEIACFSSHLRVWEYCVDADEVFLVLEDNVELASSLRKAKLLELLEALPELDYIKLAAFRERSFREIAEITTEYSLVRCRKGTRGTSAYLISPAGASKLIEGASEFVEPVDAYMEKPWRHGVITHSVHPSPFRRAQVKSIIGSNRNNKTGVSLFGKIYIEIYRMYESIQHGYYYYFR